MDSNKVSPLNVIRFAGAFIAFLIGAGFATGQEVFQYFAAYGYQGVLVGAFVLVCFVYVGGAFISAGYRERFANTNDIYRYYCGKYVGGFYDYFSIAFIYMSYIVMLGGAGATVSQHYHLAPAIGAILMMVLSAATVVFGLGKIVDVIGSIGPVIVVVAIGVGLASALSNPSGVSAGAALVTSGELEITRVGSNWFMAGTSYVGFCMLWLAAFLAAMGTKANSVKEAVLGTTLGAVGFVAGALVLMFGLLAYVGDLYTSDIPSLVIAAKVWPALATIFSVIIIAGIYTTAVPLLWSVSARFAEEKTTKFYALTAGLAAVGCFVALALPFRRIVNIIYGINGYVGILLIFFMLAASFGITKKKNGAAK
ncbi:MAG: hypothetical protein Q4D58_00030 [Synergistaceae bacterium]|nr:hypothetical protein [Synergistaceae bacterium]